MIPDRDVWAAAVLMVKRYGEDALLEAAERADQPLDEGDMAGAETWHRILNAIEVPRDGPHNIACCHASGKSIAATHTSSKFIRPSVTSPAEHEVNWRGASCAVHVTRTSRYTTGRESSVLSGPPSGACAKPESGKFRKSKPSKR